MSQAKQTSELKKIILSRKNFLIKALTISFVSAFLPIAPIVYMRAVFGPVVNAGSHEFLFWCTTVLLVMLTLAGFLEYFLSRVFFAMISSLFKELEPKIFDIAFKSRSGIDAMSGNKALQSLRQAKNFVLSPVFGAIFDIPLSLVFMGIIFYIHPIMGMMALLGAVLVLCVAILAERKIRPHMEAMRDNFASRLSYLNHSRIQTAYAMGITDNNYNKWSTLHKSYLVNQAIASDYQNASASYTKVIMLLNGSLLLGVGTFLSITGILDIRAVGNLILAKFIGMLAVRPIVQTVMSWKMLVEFRDAYQTIEEILERGYSSMQSMTLPEPTGKLEVSNLSYQLDSDKLVLDSLSFKLSPPSVCTVIGSSGAGKTTLAKLLVGVNKPTKGYVRLDGVAVYSWSSRDLGKNIGYLPQTIDLFEGTIAQNISRFEKIDSNKLKECIQLSGIQELISKLNNGLDTIIDTDGLNFSQGETKIGIARAFYGCPKYIILDEPTANLDDRSVALIINSIKYLKKAVHYYYYEPPKEFVTLADYVLSPQTVDKKCLVPAKN